MKAAEQPRRRFYRIFFREDRIFLVLAVIIGILSGLAVVAFRLAIERIRIWLLGPSLQPFSVRLILVPSVVGFIIAILVIRFFPRVRGSGVNQTKAALYIYNGYIPFRTAIGKFITAALAIGSGQSLGPEDPSLQIGASIASILGRRLRLSRDRLRLIAPVGAAAGLAAAFNAPISAVLFIIEEVIGRWSAGILGAVVLSAVSSVVVTRTLLGSEPLFHIPEVQIFQPAELVAYAALGIAGGAASVVFAKAIGFLRPRLKSLPRWTQFFQPSIAGLLVGLIGYLGAPQIMGAGYSAIDHAMRGQFIWQELGILAGLKLLASTLSFVSGTPGGMFAPTLFIGAMLGGAVGGVERIFFHQLTGPIGTYCLVGMGVLFAGFLRSPMTSVFMVLEVSGDYSIILPVIVANTLSYVISRTFQATPIFDLLSRQDGLQLPSLEHEREQSIARIEDAMRAPPTGTILHGDMLVADAIKQIEGSRENSFVVRLDATGWTAITREFLLSLRPRLEMTLAKALSGKSLPHFFSDQPLHIILRYLYLHPVLPVVYRADLGKLEGVISLDDLRAMYGTISQQGFETGFEDESGSVPEIE
jgi:CIC family chloride channel protein